MREEVIIVERPVRKTYKAPKRLSTPRKCTKTIIGTSKTKRPAKRRIKRSTLVSKLDAIFSLYIRYSHAKNGVVTCYTCSKELPVAKMQNGHYVTRSIRMLRWDERNCRPQCYSCNVMHGGQVITFRENLVKELGEDSVRQLEYLRHQLFSPTNEWLQERIEFYKKKVDILIAHC